VDRLLNAAGVVCGPVYTIADIFQDPQYRARDMLISMQDVELGELVMPGLIPKLSVTSGDLRWPGSWELGAHNGDVYGGLLGLDSAELARLAEEKVI